MALKAPRQQRQVRTRRRGERRNVDHLRRDQGVRREAVVQERGVVEEALLADKLFGVEDAGLVPELRVPFTGHLAELAVVRHGNPRSRLTVRRLDHPDREFPGWTPG